MLIWEHFLFPEVALGNTKLSTSEHTVSRTERGGPFLYSFLFMILDIKARNTLVCMWLRKRFIWQPEQWVSCLWTWRLCSRWQQSPRERSVEWESSSPPTGSWSSLSFCSLLMYLFIHTLCVALGKRTHGIEGSGGAQWKWEGSRAAYWDVGGGPGATLTTVSEDQLHS